jgi:hypothetical protein
MSKVALFFNGDYHLQSPVFAKDLYNMKYYDVMRLFRGNYRRNTGTFLMTDSLARNIDAEWIGTWEFEKLKKIGPDVIITTALHHISPEYYFDRQYWQKILNLNTNLVPISLGFRFRENEKFNLSNDMIYILNQIAERNEIGIRGEYDADVLTRYKIKNFRIIGCPSLFYFMKRDFCITKKMISKIRNINFNFNQHYDVFFINHNEFINKHKPIFLYFLNIYRQSRISVNYTMQWSFIREFGNFEVWCGFDDFIDFVLQRGKYYFSVDDWILGLKGNDFSIGSQFHGNVAAILAEIPSLIITMDKRMEELARYFKIPYINVSQFKFDIPIEYYYDMADYSEFNKNYPLVYDNFMDFCKKNRVALKKYPQDGTIK